MLIPIGHEKGTVSRIPIVTIALIITNIIVFLFTIRDINDYDANKQMTTVRMHIVLLKARYNDLVVSPDAQQIVDNLRERYPQYWRRISDPDREPVDKWEQQLADDQRPDMNRLQAEMDSLCKELTQLQDSDTSILWLYAYHSYHPKYRSFVTSQFLHGGILHLLGNMWILWLCGVLIEDAWGPFIVLAFYLVAGVFAAMFHGAIEPHSITPLIGASGSIAGLMGAMLARFPKTKIKMLFWVVIKPYTFFAPVYVLAPLWFLLEIMWGVVGDQGIAHWAHVGGFAFGLCGGFLLSISSIEKWVNPGKEDEDNPMAFEDAQFNQAETLLEQRHPDAAIAAIRPYLKKNPDSLAGYELLLKAQTWKSDTQGQVNETIPQLIRINGADGNLAGASDYLKQYRTLGGTMLPAPIWLDLCRSYEKYDMLDVAVREYQQLGQSYYATDPISLTALMSAARIMLFKLNRPQDAERLYLAARNSPIPHLELTNVIEQGLKQCAAGPKPAAKSQARF